MADRKTRKDNGEGSVFYCQNANKWVATIQYGKDSKGNILTKRYTSSKKDGKKIVTNKLKEFKKQFIMGNVSGESRITLNEYIECWFEIYQRPKVKATTYHRDLVTYDKHIKSTIGYRAIGDIQMIDIQRLINSEKDIYANKTIEKTFSLLNRVFERAVMLSDVSKNPCKGVVLPTIHSNAVKPRETTEYTVEETDKMREGIFNSFDNKKKLYRASPSYLLLLNTCMRLGELLALEWDNVDLDNKILKVTATQETISGSNGLKKVVTLPKTKSSYRSIPLNKTAIEMLTELKRRNEIQRIKSPYVVCNLKGDTFNDNNYRRDFKRFCEKYGIKYKGIHTLRHTFASRLFRRGVDVQTVSKLLGHHNTIITQNVYIHILDEQKAKAVLLFDAI